MSIADEIMISRIFQEIPERYKTELMCRDAVKEDPENLRFVPASLCRYDVCLRVVKQNGGCLRYVPEVMRDTGIVTAAFMSRTLPRLGDIPEYMRNESICLKLVKKHWRDIRYVPENVLSENFLHRAFGTEKSAEEIAIMLFHVFETMADIPECMRFPSVILYAVKEDPEQWKYAPKRMWSEDLIRRLMHICPDMIYSSLPDTLKTPKVRKLYHELV